MIDDDDDSFLYGDSKDVPEVAKPPMQTSVPQPISLERTQSVSQGLVAHLEAEAASAANGDAVPEAEEDAQYDEEGEGEEEEESEDDVEIIMEPTSRALDFRQQSSRTPNRSTSATFNTPNKVAQQPQPSLTTEYTPRERTKLSSTPQPSSIAALPALSATSNTVVNQKASEDDQQQVDSGPDPSTLPPATAPPSYPIINPAIPGTLDGRSILEVDLSALAEKPWRRPGSDISDWFNYGFDEISWEMYCYRRREIGEVAGVLKSNVLNFAGMPEEQLTALPPEIRTMVIAGATAMMAGGGAGPAAGGMMPPGAGINMNGNPMLNQMMNMNPMMNPMMHDMGVGVGAGMGMNGEMGMGMGAGGPGMQMAAAGQGMGGPGPGPGMMPDPAGPGVGVGGGPQNGGQVTPEGQMPMGVGEGFGQGGAGPGQGMMGIGMGGEYGIQDPNAMGQQMYPGMEGSSTPVPAPTPTRGGPAPGQFRGRGMPTGMRARPSYSGRGRPLPVRPASPLPPNVPTGPRNKNKYKDIDGSAPAVDGLDYGGGGLKESGRGTPDVDERNSRKRRGSPGMEDRSSKRR